MTTKEILTQAVTAKNAINSADTETKNKELANMADALLAHTDAILEANKQDVEAARGKISDVMIDRLMLDAGRIEGIIAITPIGTAVFSMTIPFGRSTVLNTFPAGSSKSISSLIPFAIPSMQQPFVLRVVMSVFFEVEKKRGRVRMP